MYNATNEHRIKMRKEGKPCGNNPPPQKTMHQKKKRKLLVNFFLHFKMIPQSMKLQPNEVLGEDTGNLFIGRIELKINGLVMYYISD
jgi:hypothetical protein